MSAGAQWPVGTEPGLRGQEPAWELVPEPPGSAASLSPLGLVFLLPRTLVKTRYCTRKALGKTGSERATFGIVHVFCLRIGEKIEPRFIEKRCYPCITWGRSWERDGHTSQAET